MPFGVVSGVGRGIGVLQGCQPFGNRNREIPEYRNKEVSIFAAFREIPKYMAYALAEAYITTCHTHTTSPADQPILKHPTGRLNTLSYI